MKYLVRAEGTFFEKVKKEGDLAAKLVPVNPKKLIHFGTDIRALEDNSQRLDDDYIGQMEKLGADYLFISSFSERVDFAQGGKRLVAVTAYKLNPKVG